MTEKLLKILVGLEALALFCVLGLIGTIKITENKSQKLKAQVTLPEYDNYDNAFTKENVDLIKYEKTHRDWVVQIQDVAFENWERKVNYTLAEEIYDSASVWSMHFDIDLETVLAQCGQESWYTNGLKVYNKSSDTHDYGVMMVNDKGIIDFNNANWQHPVTAEQVQHDVNIGIMVGCWNYANKRRILEYWGIPATEENILYAYNGGQGRVRSGNIPDSTKVYYERVQDLKAQFL